MIGLICAQCLPANRVFQNRNRTEARVRAFDLANEARQMNEMAKFAQWPVCKNNYKLL
jgi:hypothetical protein